MSDIIHNDYGYWRRVRRMSYNDLHRYAIEPMEMSEFIKLFGNGRIYRQPHWILIAGTDGHDMMYPEKDTSSLRYARSIEMLASDKCAFTRMGEILRGSNDE